MNPEITNTEDHMNQDHTNQDINHITEAMQEVHLGRQEQLQQYSTRFTNNFQNYKNQENRQKYMRHSERQQGYYRNSAQRRPTHFETQGRYDDPCYFCLEQGHQKRDCPENKKYINKLRRLQYEGKIEEYEELRIKTKEQTDKRIMMVRESVEREQETENKGKGRRYEDTYDQYKYTTGTTRNGKRFRSTRRKQCTECENEVESYQEMCKPCQEWKPLNEKLKESRKDETREEVKKRTYSTYRIAGEWCRTCDERTLNHHTHNYCKECKRLSGNGPLIEDKCTCTEPYQEIEEETIEQLDNEENNGWGPEPDNTMEWKQEMNKEMEQEPEPEQEQSEGQLAEQKQIKKEMSKKPEWEGRQDSSEDLFTI